MSDELDPKNENPGKRANASGACSEQTKPNGTKHNWNSCSAQRLRALARMRVGSVTTCELQRQYDIYDPPARICELRKEGYKIDTVWTMDETESGVLHRVGRYALRQEMAGA